MIASNLRSNGIHILKEFTKTRKSIQFFFDLGVILFSNRLSKYTEVFYLFPYIVMLVLLIYYQDIR